MTYSQNLVYNVEAKQCRLSILSVLSPISCRQSWILLIMKAEPSRKCSGEYIYPGRRSLHRTASSQSSLREIAPSLTIRIQDCLGFEDRCVPKRAKLDWILGL